MGLLETLDFRGRGGAANGGQSLDSDIARNNYYIPLEVIGWFIFGVVLTFVFYYIRYV